MKGPVCFLTIFLWLVGSVFADASRYRLQATTEGDFVLGTLNLRNYLEQNRWHAGKFRFGHPKPEAEKRAVCKMIASADVDILFLQEVGTAEHLEELRLDLIAEGNNYPFSHFLAVEEARTGLALLSREQPVQSLLLGGTRPHESPHLRRGIHEVVFDLPVGQLRILHVHLKSRYTVDDSDPEAKEERRKELESLIALAGIRETLFPGDVLLLCGDFNTPFEADFLRPLCEEWKPVRVRDDNAQLWTYHHRKSDRYETLDGFWETKKRQGAGRIVEGSLYPTQNGSVGSDHRLVTIRFKAQAGSKGKEALVDSDS